MGKPTVVTVVNLQATKTAIIKEKFPGVQSNFSIFKVGANLEKGKTPPKKSKGWLFVPPPKVWTFATSDWRRR